VGWAAPILPITIDVIVERQFLVRFNRAIRENAHPDVLSDRPLCDVAVWVAGVIRETTDPAALRGVDELRRAGHHQHG
jgi:hypothetical protein